MLLLCSDLCSEVSGSESVITLQSRDASALAADPRHTCRMHGGSSLVALPDSSVTRAELAAGEEFVDSRELKMYNWNKHFSASGWFSLHFQRKVFSDLTLVWHFRATVASSNAALGLSFRFLGRKLAAI